MKKLFKALAVIGVSAALCAPLAACGEDTAKTEQEKIYDAYVVYAEAAGEEPLSYEEWLESVQGEKGDKGDKGDQGADGADGVGIADITYSYGYNAESDYFYTEITFKLSNDETKAVVVPSAMNPEATYEAASAETLQKFMEAGVEKIVLGADISLQSFTLSDYDLQLDLNSYTLSVTGAVSSNVTNGSDVTVKNGTIAASGLLGANAHIVLGENSALTLEKVTYTATGTAIYAQGGNAEVSVTKSTIEAGGYCVGTNASVNSEQTAHLYQNITVHIANSEFRAVGSAVLFNVPGTLTVENSKLYGEEQAVFLRAGTAEISNSTLGTTYVYTNSQDNYLNKDWGEGNWAPHAALLVGSRNGTYFADATCTLIGEIKFEMIEGTEAPEIYVYESAKGHTGVNGGTPFATKLDYSQATGITSEMIVQGTDTQGVEIIAPAAAADEQA